MPPPSEPTPPTINRIEHHIQIVKDYIDHISDHRHQPHCSEYKSAIKSIEWLETNFKID